MTVAIVSLLGCPVLYTTIVCSIVAFVYAASVVVAFSATAPLKLLERLQACYDLKGCADDKLIEKEGCTAAHSFRHAQVVSG